MTLMMDQNYFCSPWPHYSWNPLTMKATIDHPFTILVALCFNLTFSLALIYHVTGRVTSTCIYMHVSTEMYVLCNQSLLTMKDSVYGRSDQRIILCLYIILGWIFFKCENSLCIHSTQKISIVCMLVLFIWMVSRTLLNTDYKKRC